MASSYTLSNAAIHIINISLTIHIARLKISNNFDLSWEPPNETNKCH